MHCTDANKKYVEKTWQLLHNNDASNIEPVLETALPKAAAVRPPTFYHQNYEN